MVEDTLSDLKGLILSKLKGRVHPDAIEEFFNLFSSPIHISRGDSIISLEDASTHLYFLADGIVAEIGRNTNGQVLIPNAYSKGSFIFNYHWFADRTPSITTYKSLTKATYLRLNQHDLFRLLETAEFEEIFFVIQQIILNQTRSHFIRLLHLKPKEYFEWMLKNQPWLISNFSRNHLAAYMGVSRATLFRILEKHKSSRYI